LAAPARSPVPSEIPDGSQSASVLDETGPSSGSVKLGNNLLVDDNVNLTNGRRRYGVAFTLTINGIVTRGSGLDHRQRAALLWLPQPANPAPPARSPSMSHRQRLLAGAVKFFHVNANQNL